MNLETDPFRFSLLVFDTFVADMRTQFAGRGAGHDPLITKLEGVMGEMREDFDNITGTLETYDSKLKAVLG